MGDIWDIIQGNFISFVMVFARVSGIFSFNPIFARNNVPNRVKVGASLALSIIMVSTMSGGYEIINTPSFALDLIKEIAIGFILGFFVNLILTVLIYAGEIIDMQAGLGMAKVMDPASGVSLPIYATFYYYWFILYFFLINGHLTYIKLFAISYETIPIGGWSLNINVAYVLVNYFAEVMILAVKFALPLLVTEMLVETAIGVIMKAVPTIHVFVINIQIKIIVAMLMLVILAPAMSEFIDYLMEILFGNLRELIPEIVAR